jgi:DNA-binding response OmpR family regulator
MCVHRKSKTVYLSHIELVVLTTLIKYKNRIVNRNELNQAIWGKEKKVKPNNLEVHMRYLRNKIDDPLFPSLIKTIRGKGYMLNLENLKT